MTASVTTGFDHLALFYRGEEDYVAGVGRFIADGMASRAPITVAVPGPHLERLRSRLPTEVVREVEWSDMAVAGRNPGRIIHQVLLAAADRRPGRQAYIVGEPIWPSRSDLEYPACAAHEALINEAFTGRNARILCPYDTVGLSAMAVADARRTHPTLVGDGRTWQSPQYDPAAAKRFNQPLPEPPPEAATMSFGEIDELATLRIFVACRAAAAGIAPRRVDEIIVAVNELATNTLEHTGDGGTVTVWTETGVLVVQVRDTGHITDPLAGRTVPARLDERGRGLFLVNMICDLVRLHTTAAGTTLRLHLAL
ncbi:MAG TPA: anti-sigma factor RsbA family regulatory protein [Micromonosporaceae bacterium]